MGKNKHRKLSLRRKQYVTGYLFLLPNFIGFFAFTLIPIIMGAGISLTDYNGFNQLNFVGFDNYIKIFSDDYFITSIKNNLLFTAVTVPATIIIATLLAVALNTGIKGKKIFRTAYFFPRISSMVVVGIVWSLLFNPSMGPINNMLMAIGIENPPKWLSSSDTALWSVMLVTVWKDVGYYMIMILAGLQNIPKQLYEAADIDGAGSVSKFFKITIPMLSPILFMVTILVMISSFQVFDLIKIMTEGGPGSSTNVVVFRIYQEGFKYLRYGYASAMAYILFFIILIITLVQFRRQKKWVNYMQ